MTVTRRAATDDDFEFCFRALKEGMRKYVVASFGAWDDIQQIRFFRHKLETHTHEVIEVDGIDAGVLCVLHHPNYVHLELISLLEEFQGRGVGGEVILYLMKTARIRGVPLYLRCLKSNPAKRLYDRLGFDVVEEQEIRWVMRYDP